MGLFEKLNPFKRTQTEAPPSPPKFEDLNESEYVWVHENIDRAKELAKTAQQSDDPVLDPAALDRLYSSLLDGDSNLNPNEIINPVGMAFGQYFVDQLRFKWQVVIDQHGSEIGVVGQPGDITVLPTNLVAKRYESNERNFLAPIYEQMQAEIARIRSLE